jgi:hypothetical protein
MLNITDELDMRAKIIFSRGLTSYEASPPSSLPQVGPDGKPQLYYLSALRYRSFIAHISSGRHHKDGNRITRI